MSILIDGLFKNNYLAISTSTGDIIIITINIIIIITKIRTPLLLPAGVQEGAGAAAAGEDGPRGGAEADTRRHQRHGEHHQAGGGHQEDGAGTTQRGFPLFGLRVILMSSF